MGRSMRLYLPYAAWPEDDRTRWQAAFKAGADPIPYTISLPRWPRPRHVGAAVEVRDRSRSEMATTRPMKPI
jgi:hypothetical protein